VARAAVYGGSGSVLFELADPIGCSLRMSLHLRLEALTKLSMRWSLKATPAGRWWWVLKLLGPRINASESGSLADWQTPSASMADAGAMSRSGDRKDELLLKGQVHAEANWPTPTSAARDERPKHFMRGNLNLAAVANDWPTPLSSDWKSTAPPNTPENARPLREVAGQAAPENPSTTGKPRGSLNPAWVAQLMGYPAGWLDLSDEIDCALLATPSSRKSSSK
jgi:hypothetical protein